jgi:hypothetical protein
MASQIIRNIQRVIIPKNNTLTYSDLATYLGAYGAGTTYGPTSDWLPISVGRPVDGAWPSTYTTYEGSHYGNLPATVLTAGINASDTTIRVTAGALETYPVPGYIYIGTEAIRYDGIVDSTTSSSGDDEFTLSTVTYRGWLNTTAAIHSTSAAVRDIIPYFAKDITRNVDAGIFNILYQATQYRREEYQAPNIQDGITTSNKVWGSAAVWFYEQLESTG